MVDRHNLQNDTTPFTQQQRESGDWNPVWSILEEWSPEFLERYLSLRNVPFKNGPLEPKIKELILVAINVSTTHLYGPGVKRHIKNAIKLGASRDEIIEVIQLTTVLGIHSCNLGIPILEEELSSAFSGDQTARSKT